MTPPAAKKPPLKRPLPLSPGRGSGESTDEPSTADVARELFPRLEALLATAAFASPADDVSKAVSALLSTCVVFMRRVVDCDVSPTATRDVIDDVRREHSLVVEMLPEVVGVASVRHAHDHALVQTMCDLSDVECMPTHYRMGKVAPPSVPPHRRSGRLLKLEFATKSMRNSFLSSHSSIRSDARFSSVRIRPSLSASQRQAEYELRQRRNELNKAGGDYCVYAGALCKRSEVTEMIAKRANLSQGASGHRTSSPATGGLSN